LSISSQAVSKWENDLSCPDISILPQLCKILGISTDELLTGENNEVRLVPVENRKSLDDMVLRIRVDSAEGDRVKVNLPMSLVKVAMEIGVEMNVTGMELPKGLDLEKIIRLVESGVVGKLVEVESADGDTVEVYVE
ncbi:MAG: helix-turn-helix transcriptional regulator, partial [Oscillospiraceae bacterium]|nr:helix-turn-helix transcriptional regulator [Oscillospiraceae bacterium]